jgi:sodium/bile acid cotransporter 7
MIDDSILDPLSHAPLVVFLPDTHISLSLQRLRPVSAWKDVQKNKKRLARLSTMFLCITPWLQLSVASSASLQLTPRLIATGVGLGVGVHCAMLAFNMAVTNLVRFSRRYEEHVAIRKAVVLCASEKTLPVAVAVIGQLGVLGAGGGAFAILPCIFSHIIQTVIDSGLVGWWNGRDERRER